MATLNEEANWKQELLAWPGDYNSNVITNNRDGEDEFFDAFIRQVMEFPPVIPSDNSVEASVPPPPSSSSSSLSSYSSYSDTTDKKLQTFHGPGAWDRSGVEIEISRPTLKLWIDDIPGLGNA